MAVILGEWCRTVPQQRKLSNTTVGPEIASRHARSITAIGSPSLTSEPSVTTTSLMMPATSASTGISIFIDSKMTTTSSALTC